MTEGASVMSRNPVSPRPAAHTWLRPWLVVGLSAWATVGVALVDRANRQGLVADIGFSPYHLVGYAALAVLVIYVIGALFRGIRRGNWRGSFPRHYEGLGLGLACLVGWVVLDTAWRNSIGIGNGIEGALAPTRLLIPVGLVLVASGPLRDALERPEAERLADRGALGAAVVAVGLIGAVVSLQGYNPVRDPLSDLVASAPRDASEIWSMATDGSAQTRLLAVHDVGVDYSLPAWSPGGDRIAFTKWTNASGSATNVRAEDQTASIWLMAADGTNPQLVVDGDPGQAWIPAWSPDGQWIAYTLNPAAGAVAEPQPQPNSAPGTIGPPSGTPGSEIWLVHPDGTGARRITDAAQDALAATWSPDGRSIAFIAGASGGTDVHVASVIETGLADDRALAADPANDWGPAWSPDGLRIAFTSNRSGNDEIWTVGLDGSGLAPLTDDPGGDWVPAWSPDGTRIAFVSDRGDDIEVWSMAADGSELQDLSNSGSTSDGQWSVAWSPDGRQLLYARAAYPAASSTPFVREDLAAAQTLLFAAILAIVALVLVALGSPLGGFAVALTIMVALAAIPSDQWRFVPGAILAGAAVDVLVRAVRPSRRARVAATALPALAVLALGVTLGLTGSLAWSVTLLLGVTTSAGLIGLGIAEAVQRLRPTTAHPTAAAPGGSHG
jgi:Tol biopolymer transport system component